MLQYKHSQQRQEHNFVKRPLERDEIMDYPYFFKMKKRNLQLNTEKVGQFYNGRLNKRRALSIISSKYNFIYLTWFLVGKNSVNTQKMSSITPWQQMNNTCSNFYHSRRQAFNSSVDQQGRGGNTTMVELIQNQYMNDYASLRREQDRENYLD